MPSTSSPPLTAEAATHPPRPLDPPRPANPANPAIVETRARFERLMEGFRSRLDTEASAFLAAKRGAPTGAGSAGRTGGESAVDGAAPALAEPADLVDGIADLMALGGKRLRPALVYYTYRCCGGSAEEQVLPVALATEFLHTYLLIHDDIMDHAEVRRGRPAAHVRFAELHRRSGLRGDAGDFGSSVAILLGDLAHTYAVELFLDGLAHASGSSTAATPRLWRELNRCFSEMCDEVIGGQYLELLLARRPHGAAAAGGAVAGPSPWFAPVPGASEAELLRVLRLKSGRYTAERPIQLGALLAGAPPEVRAELSLYGTAVGEAFQLQDDLLGLFGDPTTVGKPVGDDLREGKFTLLIHHALAAATPAERQVISAALGNPALTGGEVAEVQGILERTGARRTVTTMIAARLETARQALAALDRLGAGVAADADGPLFLSGLLGYLWEREQ
jgi:geranylgeranyl diphosphate synthase type I